MSDTLTLTCPIRGVLKTGSKSKDGLKPSEEYFRVEAIKCLLKLGYPKENFKVEAVVKRIGNAGRNSMRADLAVLDVPANMIAHGDVDALLEHALLLCEVKREVTNFEYVKHTQVLPLLDFAKLHGCVAVYWDNVDQRVFWYDLAKNKKALRDGPLAVLPKYGQKIELKPLRFPDTNATDSLIDLFDRIADLLHAAAVDPEPRYGVMLQLLLAKLFDEHGHQAKPTLELDVQDYGALGHDGPSALATFNKVLAKAVTYYQKHLPRDIEPKLPAKVSGEVLIEICKILAPVRLIASKRDVVQTFYMKFAKGLYKWDLAQFFTPPTVTDFIVDILNPQFGEHIKDPACGSADFLTAAFHKRREVDPHYAECVWGSDNSKNAVQVAILNMLLNGDGKSNIKEVDSLATVEDERDKYEILVCNPPFGVRILEKKVSTLRKFDLGHEWEWDEKKGAYKRLESLVAQQETGLLFVEACVMQAKPGDGRIGIIVPNGYLANRSKKYRVFREWLLRNCRIAAICAFPRFTFKTSGADVSASVLYFQKRDKPLSSLKSAGGHRFTVQMIENVGWNLGDKKAAPRYVRSQEDGSFVIGDDGERLLDADFASVLNDLRRSLACEDFPWLVEGIEVPKGKQGWSLPIEEVLADADLTLDAKRLCRKYQTLRAQVAKAKHFKLCDVVDFVAEKTTAAGKKVRRSDKEEYKYLELQDMGHGDFRAVPLRGWELPDRARHFAEGGDLFVGKIWGSVTKWCMMPHDAAGLVVTNGCHRLRLKKGKEAYRVDLIAFLCSEAYAVQMRALARGSDGLAEITEDDAGSVLVPELSKERRAELLPYVENLLTGTADIRSKVGALLGEGHLTYPVPPPRPSHVVLV
jgi:type I restriction enzyme M protein